MSSYTFVQTTKHPLQAVSIRNEKKPGFRSHGRISLEDILVKFSRLPSQTAILGMCSDGLPVLFDLQDDRPGSLLVCADSDSGQLELLQMIFLSTVALSSPREVQFVVVSSEPARWDWLARADGASRYLLSLVSCYERSAGDWMMKLAATVDARHAGRQNGPSILLIIDDLDFLTREDQSVLRNFSWLLEEGAAAGVWIIGAMKTPENDEQGSLARKFRTMILGRIENSQSTQAFAQPGSISTEALQTGCEFVVRIQKDWIPFELPTFQ